jgi:hypothetical protein
MHARPPTRLVSSSCSRPQFLNLICALSAPPLLTQIDGCRAIGWENPLAPHLTQTRSLSLDALNLRS